MEHGEPEIKKFKHSIVSNHVDTPQLQELFKKHWHGRIPIKTPEIEVIIEPFRVCKITNFLKSEELMDDIKNELIDVKTRRNSIDLYQFEQSNDLAKVDSDNLKKLYNTFQTDLVNWMEKNMEIELEKKISMSSSCYSDTDYLLCHDDNLGDRRIAFILYLSKNWTEQDGGTLDLFDSDENGLPRNVVKSILPEYNSLVFFEVTNNSYHQVAEITSPEKSRWSINGWFHGPIEVREKPERPEPIVQYIEPENTEIDLNQWISKVYLYPGIMKEIQEDVEQDSFAFLSDFLKPDVYKILSEEVISDNIKWTKVGPADIRNYEIAQEDSLPETLANFCSVFKSITLFQLLKNYTELDLVPEGEGMDPKMTIELQRWSKGCYTLITDKYNQKENVVNSSNSSNNTTVASNTEKKCSTNNHTAKSEPELAPTAVDHATSSKISRVNNHYIEQEPESNDKKISEEAGCCNTPPSSVGDNEYEEEEIAKSVAKSPKSSSKKVGSSAQLSPIKAEVSQQEPPTTRNFDTDDSDVSDIGDYLSDPLDCSFECSEQEDEAGADEEDVAEEAEEEGEETAVEEEPGSLDIIMQFNTAQTIENETIDYVDTREEDGALIHVPSKDNHLCLVYKTVGTSRVHKYVNHYCKGYFYNLICTYYE